MILVSGCQRTGTTLMCLMLDAHPSLKIHGDGFGVHLMEGKVPQQNEGGKIVMCAAQWRYFFKHFPNATYVFMYRNLLDVVASMLSLTGDKGNWSQAYSIEETARAIFGMKDDIGAFYVSGYLGQVYRTGDFVRLAALCAYMKMRLVEEYMAFSDHRCVPVKYEELVENPEPIMREVLTRSDIAWDDSVLRHHQIHKDYVFAGTRSTRPVDNTSIGKWKSVLSEPQVESIREVCLDLQNMLQNNPWWLEL